MEQNSTLQIRVSKGLKWKLKQLCQRKNMSVSDLLRIMIEEEVQKNKGVGG